MTAQLSLSTPSQPKNVGRNISFRALLPLSPKGRGSKVRVLIQRASWRATKILPLLSLCHSERSEESRTPSLQRPSYNPQPSHLAQPAKKCRTEFIPSPQDVAFRATDYPPPSQSRRSTTVSVPSFIIQSRRGEESRMPFLL